MGEQLDEEELALFDLLTKPQIEMSKADRDKVKATARARELIGDVPPSSPSLALLKDGELVHFVPRHMIEGHAPEGVAAQLPSGETRARLGTPGVLSS